MRASPTDIASLAGQRVALWGWGREGRGAYAALRAARDRGLGIGEDQPAAVVKHAEERFPGTLTLFCTSAEAEDARALGDPGLAVETEATAERLAAFDVVIKSPGISPYRPEVLAAMERGTRFIGGTALWFGQRPDARTVCVTGTKGKSTTSALLAHLLRAGGHRTALSGNIGQPLLELLDGEAAFWVVELSSYQTRDVAASGVRPDVALVTNIFPEHLDWHGGQARYVEDKLSLLTQGHPRVAVLNAADQTLAALGDRLVDSRVDWFGDAAGWHLRGDALWRGEREVLDTRALPLPGRHNRANLCGVLAAIEALGLDAMALAPHATSFRPLPHRLQTLGARGGIEFVNDSISTTPHASLAALDVFDGRRVAILVGGHDRGLDWSGFVEAVRRRPPAAIVTMGQNGPRIHALLEDVAGVALHAAVDLPGAVATATAALDGEGVVLLSPGAPSFGAYRDYAARGRHFAEVAGFDPAAIAEIPGIGIA